MKKTSDYEAARKKIIGDRNNPSARRKRAEIRDRDERNIRKYGECPARFSDFLSERKGSEEIKNEETHPEAYKNAAVAISLLKNNLRALVTVAERNEIRLPPEEQAKFLMNSIRRFLSDVEEYERKNLDAGVFQEPFHWKTQFQR